MIYTNLHKEYFHSLTDQLDARLSRRDVIYNGTQERHEAHIEVLNYTSLLSD